MSRSSLRLHQLRRVTACVTTSEYPPNSESRPCVTVCPALVCQCRCVYAACVCVCVCVCHSVCVPVCVMCVTACVCAHARVCVSVSCSVFRVVTDLPSETAMTDQKWRAIAGRQPDSNTRTPQHSQSVQKRRHWPITSPGRSTA